MNINSHIKTWAYHAMQDGSLNLLHDDIYVALYDIELNQYITNHEKLTGKKLRNHILYADDTPIQCHQNSNNWVIHIFTKKDDIINVMAVMVDPVEPVRIGKIIITWNKEKGVLVTNNPKVVSY